MTDSREEQVLETIRKSQALPTIPAVAVAVLRMSHDPRTSIEMLAEVIEKDPALAAKTLRFANSCYYGASKPIVSMPQALVRIGVRGAKMLALSFSLVGVCRKLGSADYDYNGLWQRSLTSAVAARRIATRSVQDLANAAFITALLADIGCPVLARTFPDRYRALQKLSSNGHRDLVRVEEQSLGIGHPKVSRMMLELWHLPGELTEAVAAHHDLAGLDRQGHAFAVAAVAMAASDLTDIVLFGATSQKVQRLAALFQECFSFTSQHIDLMMKDLGPEIRQVGAMLDLPCPPPEELHADAKREMLKLAMTGAVAGEPQAGSA